jgi:hypothetical protein
MAKGGARAGAGRKRRPLEAKVIEGRFRKDRDAATPPVVGGFPSQPADLTAAEAELWEAFPKPAWIGETDVIAVRAAVNLYARVLEIQRVEQETGEPAHDAALKVWGRLMSALSALGLTPADRGKMHAPKPNSQEGDEWAKLLG